jgi:hypothetical protein
MAENHIYREDFNKYAKDNPYHDKLKAFEAFVMRDEEAEIHRGKWKDVFGNEQALNVEIGTGYGEFMLEWCGNNPTENFVGLDHRFKRSFHLAKKLDKITNKNFRYLRGRGERLEFIFGEAEVSNIFYFFPRQKFMKFFIFFVIHLNQASIFCNSIFVFSFLLHCYNFHFTTSMSYSRAFPQA